MRLVPGAHVLHTLSRRWDGGAYPNSEHAGTRPWEEAQTQSPGQGHLPALLTAWSLAPTVHPQERGLSEAVVSRVPRPHLLYPTPSVPGVLTSMPPLTARLLSAQ